MRTTLDIADDVLLAARELARRRRSTAGKVLSDLARRGLLEERTIAAGASERSILGFRPFPSRGGLVTNDLVDRIRDDEGI